ncbi:MAG: hypothetical protein RIR93_282, partial [Actinomycetota bacterium]
MRIKSFFLSFLIAFSFLSPIPNASALEIKVAPAGWASIFASGDSNVATSTPRIFYANLEKKSSFVPIYNNVPAQAKEAIQAAIDIWSQNFKSSVPVNISISWTRPINDSVLASASAKNVFANFTGAPDKTLYYTSALANALAGRDLDVNDPELVIEVSSNANWYFGTDGKCPPRSYDLVSVILHEMAHGLGFMSGSYYDSTTGEGRILQPTPFDAYAQLPDGRRLIDLPSPSLEIGKAMTTALFWSGANGVKANNGIKPLLFTPSIYERGSSVSHLDEKTFSNTGENSAMTPNLDAGEVFHSPGSLVLAMFEDLRQTPPAGKVTGVPDSPQNVKAFVGDKSAIIKFDPPPSFRFSQVDSYLVENLQTGESITASQSPVIVTGLKNGSKYTFSVAAINSAGSSVAIKSNQVVPQAVWASSVIDKNADAKYLASNYFAGRPVIAYTDTKAGDLKLATLINNKWSIQTIDGNNEKSGKTLNNVAGYVSLCTSKSGKINYLHVFYTDVTNKDLKYALYDGKKWKYEIVDGNGPRAQDYKETDRVRGASDVSISNACAVTSEGVQVFYRDESQGILLGAVKQDDEWRYEIVDGEKDTDNKTTGDVGFHLKSITVGKKVILIYDSVKGFDADKNVTRGEIRYASRSTTSTLDWEFKTLDIPSDRIYAAGFDVAIFNSLKGVELGWFAAGGALFPNPDLIKFQGAKSESADSFTSELFGTPNSPISIDEKLILFGCELRLCAINKSNKSIALVSKGLIQKDSKAELLVLNKIRYA